MTGGSDVGREARLAQEDVAAGGLRDGRAGEGVERDVAAGLRGELRVDGLAVDRTAAQEHAHEAPSRVEMGMVANQMD